MSEFDKVEILTDKLHVSFEEAAKALRKCGGDLLDAMRYLEKILDDRKYGNPEPAVDPVRKAEEERERKAAEERMRALEEERARIRAEERAKIYAEERRQACRREAERRGCGEPKSDSPSFGSWLGSVIRKSMENYLVVSHEGVVKFRISIFALVLLFMIFHATLIVAMVVSLFFGVQYSFKGKDDLSGVNEVIGRAGNSASEWWEKRSDVDDLCRKYDIDDLSRKNNDDEKK